jgi:hypothetical protein
MSCPARPCGEVALSLDNAEFDEVDVGYTDEEVPEPESEQALVA